MKKANQNTQNASNETATPVNAPKATAKAASKKPAAVVAGNGTKIKTGKTIVDLSVRSYQELAKMYGNGFVGKSKAVLIEELTARG